MPRRAAAPPSSASWSTPWTFPIWGARKSLQAVVSAAAPPAWREVLVGGGRARLSAGLALMEFMVGIQFLVVTAVMPRVVREIGGIEFYGAVFAGYMLAGLVSIPRTGHQADAGGPAQPFGRMMLVFIAGTIFCGLAPNMPLLALARLVQGYGGGAMYSLAYAVVAKSYPERGRARMVALLTTVWVGSGVVGPGYGALMATLLSWRIAFWSVVPLAVATALLVLPSLRNLQIDKTELGDLPLRWPLQVATGAALMVGGFSSPTWAGAIAIGAGAIVLLPALRHVLPAGTLMCRPGLPAAAALAFLTSVSFFTADSFVPLALTGVRGQTVTTAGVAVTLVSVSWSVATVWQARAVEHRSLASLTTAGAAILALGTAGFAAALFGAPLWLAYAGWTVAGLGMGVAFPSIYLAAVKTAGAGHEASAVASRFVSGRIGVVLGTGLGGFAVAITQARHFWLGSGLAAAFGLAIAAALAGSLLDPRLIHEAAAAPG